MTRQLVPCPKGLEMWDRDALSLLATLVAGEALSENWLGKISVAWVVKNRVEAQQPSWFGTGWHEVILKKWQFSAFNKGTGGLLMKLQDPEKWAGQTKWYECYRAACGVFYEFVLDPTGGADHYHTVHKPSYAKVWPPFWVQDTEPTATIDSHVFYKLRKGR